MSKDRKRQLSEIARRYESGQHIFIIRPMKTAGTTLRNRLIQSFSYKEVYPAKIDRNPDKFKDIISISHLYKIWDKRKKSLKVVDGHFPLSATKLFEEQFITIGLLRPPLQRTLSYLNHQKVWVPSDRDKSLEEIYDDPVKFPGIIRNHMTRMFGMTWQQMYSHDGIWSHTKDNKQLLENAKAGVESLDFIGLQPEFELFWKELAQTLNFDDTLSQISNTAPRVEPSPELIERIKQDNRLDFKLYRFARDLVHQRRGETHNS